MKLNEKIRTKKERAAQARRHKRKEKKKEIETILASRNTIGANALCTLRPLCPNIREIEPALHQSETKGDISLTEHCFLEDSAGSYKPQQVKPVG